MYSQLEMWALRQKLKCDDSKAETGLNHDSVMRLVGIIQQLNSRPIDKVSKNLNFFVALLAARAQTRAAKKCALKATYKAPQIYLRKPRLTNKSHFSVLVPN